MRTGRRFLVVMAVLITATWSSAASALQVRTISGSPLVIHVGEDLSFQVDNGSNTGQYAPHSATPADAGIFLKSGDNTGPLFSPDFSAHSSTKFGESFNAWTPSSISGPTGSGTVADPFVIVATATGGSWTAELTVQYVQGDNFFNVSVTVTNGGTATGHARLFLGADLFVKDDDKGHPIKVGSMVGGEHGDLLCHSDNYRVLLAPVGTADGYDSEPFDEIWIDISQFGNLDNATDNFCPDVGSALQWVRDIPAGESRKVQAGLTFGDAPSEECVDPCIRASGTMSIPFIPNAFTPNGDGLNDTWCIFGITNVSTLQVLIFDRWGNLIKDDTYHPGHDHAVICAWDGTKSGGPAQEDVYTYRLIAHNCGSDELIIIDKVTLVR